ncbi:pyruvate, water dikinase regulatory protein [Thalassospira xianhensis]|uniref:Putative pyruvate, phosphate dikinase regulatory protein n=1 Tax=Thalassospira xianhensis MCCC 1A02616 TaxID=1177929 RepID=A0A367UG05_9PROT|nr:pyruvate, water dikinase regulatory protein [Thalassospira xianhensis]RCK07138.1 phosphate kinase [Thalassospira xianhensis MCCC 1A02616]
MIDEDNIFHLHLVSDSTGETVDGVARACIAQFPDVRAHEHVWSLIRTDAQLARVLADIERNPGIVLYTVFDMDIRRKLEEGCRRLQVPHSHVLDNTITMMAGYLGQQSRGRTGALHKMDEDYFNRIEAIDYTLSHDDGQSTWDLEEADVVIVGVSRTSKTPTSVYLANRGIKTANVPFVPGCPLPPELDKLKNPLVVGLIKDVDQLVSIRKNRLRQIERGEGGDYVDPVAVRNEVHQARRYFTDRSWKIINVTRRSIEETAAIILSTMYDRRGH